jgi:DNA-binding PadR family transcriptional regulator
MALRHVLLGLLVDQSDHAYALKHRLSPGAPRDQLVNDGVLYPLLAKLQAEGLAASVERPGRNGRLRRIYSVTSSGRAEFRRWLLSDEDEQAPLIYEAFVGHPLVKLLFADHLSDRALRVKLERQVRQVAERIAALESFRSIAPGDALAGLGTSLLDLELRQLGDRLGWLREALVTPP